MFKQKGFERVRGRFSMGFYFRETLRAYMHMRTYAHMHIHKVTKHVTCVHVHVHVHEFDDVHVVHK